MKLRNYLLLSISTILLASCSSEAITNDTPAEERLPLRLEATFSNSRAVTRAVGDAFEANDKLISLVQHVYLDGSEYKAVNGIQASLVTFTKGNASMENGETSDLTTGEALYWDDFSNSSAEATDLRTANHGLRSYYGYCYNGGTPSTALTETSGVLGWTIAVDQTEGIKQYDLLWSKTTGAVTYDHAKDNRGTLSVPFTHAMSKFTIVVVAGDGFKDDDLTTATVKLFGMNSTGTFTAPTATVVPGSETVDIDMYGNTASTTDHSRAFEAVAVPQSNLSVNKHLATITMAGNTYKVLITSDVLTKWGDGKSKSGYNYKLTVTLNKQAVDVKATLANWTDVSATGNGDIAFNNDIVNFTVDNPGNEFAEGSSFNLYWKESKATDYTFATESTLTSGKWSNATAIYWPNGTDSYYFRALTGNTNDFDVKQGEDVLWGTTAEHKGNGSIDYTEGAAINPRTGDVPLIFKHAMAKITFDLTTTVGDDKVDLDDAKIAICNLYTDGTINIADGKISGTTSTVAAISDLTENTAVIVLPQVIDDQAIVTITLKDGSTKYKSQLNTCTAGTTPIASWERGKSYTYTITVKKEAVQFRALVQDWTETTGSGNANLDWD